MIALENKQTPLSSFYLEDGLGKLDVTLAEILAWDDETLEAKHTYIQWLFPLNVKSEVVLYSPVLTQDEIGLFVTNKKIQKNINDAFSRMLDFYGFKFSETIEIDYEHPKEWLTPKNHNFLRLSRIMGSLRILGQGHKAQQLFDALKEIANEDPRGYLLEDSMGYWEDILS
jgi:hypothetical protein